MEQKRIILIGAGHRGLTYTNVTKDNFPDRFKVVGVADPDPVQIEYVKKRHALTDDQCFASWEDILSKPKFADACIIATQDRLHFEPAMKAISLGYDILLEKPAAPTPEECIVLSDTAHKYGVRVVICHVLRYSPFFVKLKKLIDEGRVGRVINIIHTECVGNVHQSHSFVRGNWRNSETSTPMILAKCCHDIDILQWLVDRPCTKVQSFGSLSYFKRENKPEGTPERCTENCPIADTCPYNSKTVYMKRKLFIEDGTKKVNPSDEDIEHLATKTDYARCVFSCDNNVVDHQVVNLEYDDGTAVSMTMSAFNRGGRSIHIMGTKGEINAGMKDPIIKVYNFETCKYDEYPVNDAVTDEHITGGHGGGDYGIIRAFCELLFGEYTGNAITDVSVSIDNHLTTFAAEESRVAGKVISMDEYIKTCRAHAKELGYYNI